jgi:hypothetical protein
MDNQILLILYLVGFFLSGCLYSIFYAKAESIVCIRIHLALHPLCDFYHLCRLLDKLGLFLLGVFTMLSIDKIYATGNPAVMLFFFVWIIISIWISLALFNFNFDGTGNDLLNIDEKWKFSTGWLALDRVLGFHW